MISAQLCYDCMRFIVRSTQVAQKFNSRFAFTRCQQRAATAEGCTVYQSHLQVTNYRSLPILETFPETLKQCKYLFLYEFGKDFSRRTHQELPYQVERRPLRAHYDSSSQYLSIKKYKSSNVSVRCKIRYTRPVSTTMIPD